MKKQSAFSLLELSVVVLIIGVLIAGITQATIMVKEARLKSARTLTQASPVAAIDDLMLWYETSLETSFDSSEQSDGSAISTWYDNSKQSNVRNDATQSTSGYRPLFKTNIFNNGIPSVRFDGTDDLMTFDGSLLVKSDYTVFAVEQRRASSGYFFFGGTTTGTTNANLHFGYATPTYMRLGQYNVNLDYSSIPSYSSPIPRIHSGRLKQSVSRDYWLNGGTTAEATNTTSSFTTALVSYTGPALGRTIINTGTVYFKGDIAEIIIFTRALPTEERQAIETYLGKKYGITIS